MSFGLKVQIEEEGEVSIVRIEGRLDATNAPKLENKLLELVDGGRKFIILSLAGVHYLSSAGMRLLLLMTKKLVRQGCFCLCSVNEEVLEIIKMAGFDKILHIHHNEQDALNAIKPASEA